MIGVLHQTKFLFSDSYLDWEIAIGIEVYAAVDRDTRARTGLAVLNFNMSRMIEDD